MVPQYLFSILAVVPSKTYYNQQKAQSISPHMWKKWLPQHLRKGYDICNDICSGPPGLLK